MLKDRKSVFYGSINYLVISSTTSDKLYYPRYALPVVVVLTVLAGRALVDFTRGIARQYVAKMAIITAGLIAIPVSQSIVTAYALNQTDTRTLAKDWIDSNISAGSRVLIEGLKIAPIKGTVQLHETPEAIKRRIEYWRLRESKQAKFLELQLAVHKGGGYDLEFIPRESVLTLDEYLAGDVEYFVVRPDYFVESRRAGASSARLISALRSDARVRFVKRFEGDTRTRFGPTIEVYGHVTRPR